MINRALFAVYRVLESIGRAVAWLVPLMVAATVVVVVLRYLFNTGAIALQEAVTYMHGAVFMLGAAATMRADGHVRVDFWYRRQRAARRAWIDGLGHLFLLLPVCALILSSSWDYVLLSWRVREVSTEPGGIPAVFALKTLIPLFAVTLIGYGVANGARHARRGLRRLANARRRQREGD